jgi:hypothetical protein
VGPGQHAVDVDAQVVDPDVAGLGRGDQVAHEASPEGEQ